MHSCANSIGLILPLLYYLPEVTLEPFFLLLHPSPSTLHTLQHPSPHQPTCRCPQPLTADMHSHLPFPAYFKSSTKMSTPFDLVMLWAQARLCESLSLRPRPCEPSKKFSCSLSPWKNERATPVYGHNETGTSEFWGFGLHSLAAIRQNACLSPQRAQHSGKCTLSWIILESNC